eukprot:GFYU01000502.1.p1 GENE.GFYU01000502.1~~GFYU01000502.1.p1  ORF type:complete len:737 (+),score=298.34 GFYU01000502.1:26-2212(+)
MSKIYYTLTDEAPFLATHSLLPIIKRFTNVYGVDVEKIDISVAARVLAQFGFHADTLSELGEIAKKPDGIIVKLPNISASIPQLNAAIAELQSKGYAVPNYPADPQTPEEKEIQAKYAKVLGSAVNPVLREGNSDRHCAPSVKKYAQKNPHKLQAWPEASKSHVAHMQGGDFFASEQSLCVPAAGAARIELVAADGSVKVMKESVPLLEGEVIDSSFMSAKALRAYFEEELQAAKKDDVLVSLHLKATMMKISDPIIFGHCVSVFFKSAFEKHADALAKVGANPNNGLAAVFEKVATLPDKDAIMADFAACYNERPRIAMVNSAKGITNLHVPSDVIIDASMPPMVRDGGRMWNKDDKLEDTKCLIPDRSYGEYYAEIVRYVRETGQFDVSTMGHVSNIGLMAKKAEEYGSHDKTFELPYDGTMRVVDAANGAVLMQHNVEKGDIWRMCQTKDVAIKDWVGLAIRRSREWNTPVIFWLDERRAHDRVIIEKVNKYLAELDTNGLDVTIKPAPEAARISMQRQKEGKDTISATGNVLRDYNTDMFPILELGTSAKMLSIVPLLAGGGMYETGAGGSAPKHVEQFVAENHLRWDSLGEYLAVGVCLEDLANKTGNEKMKLLGNTLNEAIGKVLDNNKSPSRKVNEPDNRATNFYIMMYWAQALAAHDGQFKGLADKLAENETTIVNDLVSCQGKPVDIGGYYYPDFKKTDVAMRPSSVLNALTDNISSAL